MRPELLLLASILFCGFTISTNDAFPLVRAGNDTLPNAIRKTVSSVRYNEETREYHVRYSDGTSEAMNRRTLDEKGIYFPGVPQQADTANSENELKTDEKDPSVDTALWQNHLEKYLPEYLQYASKRGLRRGTYVVHVRFLVNKDGSLSHFSAVPDPGYRFLEFIEAILKNGPKWKPAEQNGKKLRSFHTQPITFRISNHPDSE